MITLKTKDNLKRFYERSNIMQLFRELDITPKGAKLAEKVNTKEALSWRDICSEYYPTDEIILTSDTIYFLERFLSSSGFDEKAIDIPDDLILESKTPLPNIILNLNGDKDSHSYRFVLDGQDLYIVSILDSQLFYQNKNSYIGNENYTIITKFKHEDCFYKTDLEEVYTSNERMNPNRKDIRISVKQRLIDYYHSHYNYVNIMLHSWYAIQLLLLHPQIIKSDILKRDRKVKISDPVLHVSKSRKRKACYVKRETINTDIFNSKEFTRKTMCWYVIGHYRKHGEGRVWVNGYWKGPLRDTKKNHDEGRERILKGV